MSGGTLDELATSPIFTWVTAGAVVSLISLATSGWWERRKLSRAERSAAYSNFLDSFSRRWRAFGDRDGARRRNDTALEVDAEERINMLRDSLYNAYTMIQILGSQEVVQAALQLIRASDQRNKSFKDGGVTPGVGADARAELLAAFVAAARKDIGLRKLDRNKLKSTQKDAIPP